MQVIVIQSPKALRGICAGCSGRKGEREGPPLFWTYRQRGDLVVGAFLLPQNQAVSGSI